MRVWDSLLCEGPKILYRVSLALLKTNEAALMQIGDAGSVLHHLRAANASIHDRDALMTVRSAVSFVHQFCSVNLSFPITASSSICLRRLLLHATSVAAAQGCSIQLHERSVWMMHLACPSWLMHWTAFCAS